MSIDNLPHKKYSCEKCNKNFKYLHGPERSLCYNCYNKNRIPNGPIIFNEPVNKAIQANTILITTSQFNILEKRLKYLFPLSTNKTHNLPNISKYLRELILNDLQNWEEEEC